MAWTCGHNFTIGYGERMTTVRDSMRSSANAILTSIDRVEKDIELMIQSVYQCKGSVVVTGVGKSGLVGKKISSSLRSVGVKATFIDATEAFHGDIGYLKSEDMVLALSNSGKTKEVVLFVEYAKKIGCEVAGILGRRDAPMVQFMDQTIDARVESESHAANFIPSASTSLALAIGDALVVGLAELADFQVEDFTMFHPSGALGDELSQRVIDVMIPKKNCAVIGEEKTLKAAAQEMNLKAHGILLVEDVAGKVCGVLTDGDLRRALIDSLHLEKTRVSDICSYDPLTVETNDNVRAAINSLETGRKHPVSAAPVVNAEQQVVGVITIHLLTQSGGSS